MKSNTELVDYSRPILVVDTLPFLSKICISQLFRFFFRILDNATPNIIFNLDICANRIITKLFQSCTCFDIHCAAHVRHYPHLQGHYTDDV